MSNQKVQGCAAECLRLQEFKKFLQEFALNKQKASAGVIGVEMRSSVTRANNETYLVSSDELEPEIIAYLWIQLQSRKCPPCFQLKLLHAAVADIMQNCSHRKESEVIGKMTTKSCGKENGVDVPLTQTAQFDVLKLQKLALQQLELLLERLSDNTEAVNLVNYADAAVLCSDRVNKCACGIDVKSTQFVTASIKNKPRKMEDRHMCLQYFSELYQLEQPAQSSLYAVFDGHSGANAAVYATSQLPYLLAAQLKSTHFDEDDLVSGYRNCFESAFLQTDKKFGAKQIGSGTTAVCALITSTENVSNHLYIGWVGDSRALLVSASASLQLVKSHKPDAADERKRIESAGGAVLYVQGQWRVSGILNVSRSIGDYALTAVISEPDFVDVPLTAAHDFLVLATDGLWDHVSEETTVKTIYEALANHDQKVEDIPKLLIDLAKQGDSQDNITVVIVFLKSRAEIVENHQQSPAALQ